MSILRYLLERLGRSLKRGAAFGVLCTALAVALAGCGSGPEFRLVKGLGTQNLQVVYYADGVFQ